MYYVQSHSWDVVETSTIFGAPTRDLVLFELPVPVATLDPLHRPCIGVATWCNSGVALFFTKRKQGRTVVLLKTQNAKGKWKSKPSSIICQVKPGSSLAPIIKSEGRLVLYFQNKDGAIMRADTMLLGSVLEKEAEWMMGPHDEEKGEEEEEDPGEEKEGETSRAGKSKPEVQGEGSGTKDTE